MGAEDEKKIREGGGGAMLDASRAIADAAAPLVPPTHVLIYALIPRASAGSQPVVASSCPVAIDPPVLGGFFFAVGKILDEEEALSLEESRPILRPPPRGDAH